MKRPVLSTIVFLLAGLFSMPGCDWPHQGLRRKARDADAEKAVSKEDEVDSNKILDVQSDPAKPKPFFRPSGLAGGLSDEAREIESHMGIR